MGFSVGGEYTGVVAYLIEGAPPGRRGLITSLAAAASEIGALLAAGISAVVLASMSDAALASWGWRIPFLFGAAMAAAVLMARLSLQESPEFERQQRAGTVPSQPALHAIRVNRGAIARGFAISALGSISYYVGITYVPAFLVATRTMAEGQALWLATIAAVVVIVVTPLIGHLSDRIGRRPVLLGVTLLCAVLPISLFSGMAGSPFVAALLGAVVLAALGGAFSAVGAVATAELLAGEGRLSGLAIGATGATAIFGGVTPFLAQLGIEQTGMASLPGLMIAAVALAVAPILWLMPETRPKDVAPTDGG
jgi:MHS family proline/betaine transporter-like MFS transporter